MFDDGLRVSVADRCLFMNPNNHHKLLTMYQAMRKAHRHRHWWPGETNWEIMTGAILTQNTAWKNVEKAIANLKKAGLLSIDGIRKTPLRKLARLISPSGYFNQKAKKLKALVQFIDDRYGGSLARMRRAELEELRPQLLQVWGIGPETADSILLYALDKPIFVVDAYTKRILQRHEMITEEDDYDSIQNFFMNQFPKDVALYNDYHAQLVAVGHRYCGRSKTLCHQCPLNPFLPHP